MAAHASTVGSGTLGFADPGEIDRFVETLGRFERGEIDADAWRAFRLVAGTYGQRQVGELSMLRAKIPQGLLTSSQLETVASVADRYSRGFAHVTTRQNFQFHFMKLSEIAGAMEELGRAGITTREACGNAVRNVTTSPTAGVAHDEVFDPTPYASALTSYLLRHPLSASLPRKFKIAVTGGGADHAFALVNDLGWHARIETHEGRTVRGFRLTVGGGTALWCQSGRELFSFLPASDMFGVTLAILRVFHARGDRVHRHRNRLRYLIKTMGWAAWHQAFEEQLALVRKEGIPKLPFDPETPPPAKSERRAEIRTPREQLLRSVRELVENDAPRGPGITPRLLPQVGDSARFLRTNVRPQRQAGYSIVTVTVPLGDLTSGRLRALACIARERGEGEVRTTTAQNVILRWIRDEDVETVYALLDAIGLASPDPDSIADVTSCPGAESCKLAVTQSRGLARELGDTFASDLSLVDKAEGLVVKVSGCPNGCSLHHIAGLGFQGGLRKVGGRPAPYYHVYAGGDPTGDVAKFGRVIGKLPAKRVAEATRRLIELYEAKRIEGESITAYLSRAPVSELKAAIADLESLDETTAGPEHFVDFAEEGPFRPDTTEGECAA